MQSYKAKIVSHEFELNGKVVYVIQVVEECSKRNKTMHLRYSEIRDIHEELQKLIDKLKLHLVLPEFPVRKMFGATNKSEDAISKRMQELEAYINKLLQIQKLHCLDIMKKHFIPLENEQSYKNQINMQICIDRYTLVEDAVTYYVRLRDLNSHEEWTFKARYSELRNVHEALQESKIKNLPAFPKKKIFGITNQSPDDIEKRREELVRYFNDIFNIRQILCSDAIKYFIQESKKQAKKDKELEALRKKGDR